MNSPNKHRFWSRDLDDPDTEIRTLEWKYRDYLQLSRLDELQRLLDSGTALSVLRYERTMSKFNLLIRFDNGWSLRLKLHQPADDQFASIHGLHWSDRSSWIVDGRSSDGTPIRCYAWRVVVTFSSGDQ